MSAPKPKIEIEEYSPSGYPKNNKTFTREAKKLLKSRKADLDRVERYFNEMSRALEEKLPK
jgi:hypothetical protein